MRLLITIAASLSLVASTWAQRPAATYIVVLDAPSVAEVKIAAEKGRPAPQAQIGHTQVRAALEAGGLEVLGGVERTLNALFIRATPDEAGQVRSYLGVKRVVRARRFKPLLNRAVDIVRAPEAWRALGGDSRAGEGMRIAIIDSGIDQTHPALQDPGVRPPDGFPISLDIDREFTNNKIIVARSYAHLLSLLDPAASRPDDETPRDRTGHGTAIAMIAAGRPVDSPVGRLTGVAPKAFLGNYKVFGSPDINEFTNDAALIQAIDDAVLDGMHILSISSGGPAEFPFDHASDVLCTDRPDFLCDPVAWTLENAMTGFGVVVVVSAGNAGAFGEQAFPTLSSISSPATAPSVVSVGATVNARQLIQSVRFGSDTVRALSGVGPELGSVLTRQAIDAATVGDPLGCQAYPAGAFRQSIAVIKRGECDNEFKVAFAADAGAEAVIIVNLTGREDPEVIVGLEATDVPAFMVGVLDGLRLFEYLAGSNDDEVSIDPRFQEMGFASDQVAPFSSRGPSVGGDIKPEIVAPGTFIYSAAQRYDSNGDLFSQTRFDSADGTSFAAPFVSGAAALVWQANPDFTPAQVKSALVNTAAQSLVEDGALPRTNSVGGGLLNVPAALDPIATVEPATVSFGSVAGVGLPLTVELTVTNVSDIVATYQVDVFPRDVDPNARILVDGATTINFRLDVGLNRLVQVSLTGAAPAPGQYDGVIRISRDAGGVELLVPYYYVVGDGVPANALPISGSGVIGTVNEEHPEILLMKVVDRYGQPVANLATSYVVEAGGGAVFQGDPATDEFGVSGAIVDLGPDPGQHIFVGRAGTLEVPFFNQARAKPGITGVVNAAGFAPNRPVAPGSIVSIFGFSLAEFSGSATTIPLPVALKHVSVSFDGPEFAYPGRMFFSSDGQLNLQVPWETAGLGAVDIKVRIEDTVSGIFRLDLSDSAPGVFDFVLNGERWGIATHADGSLVTPANAARPGETIIVYGTGWGPVDVAQQSGEPAGSSPLARTRGAPTVRIGDMTGRVTFSGLSPGFVGLYQVNVAIPRNRPPGDYILTLTINGAVSNEVRIAIR